MSEFRRKATNLYYPRTVLSSRRMTARWFTLLITLIWAVPSTWAAYESRRDSSGGPYARIMPAPLVFPALHETVRDNPAALRQDKTWSFQTMGSPNFSTARHGLDGGAAWANGMFGVGYLVETTVGEINDLDDMTLGFSSGVGVFSGGVSLSISDFARPDPRVTVGFLFGSTRGSHGAIGLYELGDPIDAAFVRLGYGYLNEGAFNFELFAESPPFGQLPQGVFRLGMATALYIDAWSIGFSASYGFNPAAGFTPGGSPGSNAMRFSIGASKWLSDITNLQFRFSEDLSLSVGFTLAFPAR
jgi:hypothetical protein